MYYVYDVMLYYMVLYYSMLIWAAGPVRAEGDSIL